MGAWEQIPALPNSNNLGRQGDFCGIADIHIATFNPGEVCAQVHTPWELTVSIGQLSPATYTIRVTHNCPFGCPREIGHDTFTVVSSTVGGLVTGVSPRTVVCQNLTTRQSVTLRDGARAWDCEAAGLAAREGDKIRQTVIGTRDPKVYGPTCTPTTSDPYNCRLDTGQLCLNITRNDYPTEATCLANLCDLYGPANAQVGFASWCVYNGRAIKGYATSGMYQAGDFCAADTAVPYEELKVYRSDGVATYCEYEGQRCPGSGAPAAWELPVGMMFTGPCP